MEAQGLRDSFEDFKARNVKVFGVSTDSAESHAAFIKKHNLPFPLVVDDGAKVAEAFGVPSRVGYLARQSVLIDDKGAIAQVWREVDPATHAATVLAVLPKPSK